jgi:hypothetical protein
MFMQTRVSERWPLSGLCADMLASAVGRFLRTHRQGLKLLDEFMASAPPDRTEEQFEQERRQAKEARQAAEQRVRASLIARRLAGLPLIDETLMLSESKSD